MKKLILLTFLIAFFWGLSREDGINSVTNYSSQILANCKGAYYKTGCYEDEIPKLMDRISMEEAFAVTKEIQKNDPSFAFCHITGHRLAAKEVVKDSSKWKEVIPRCPSGLCSDGCIHGAFQEKYKSDKLSSGTLDFTASFKTICDSLAWNPTGFEKDGCYHALGHLAMYVAQGDALKVQTLCSTLGEGIEEPRMLCLDGAFMQIFQPVEPEDFALSRIKNVKAYNLLPFCSEMEEPVRSACITEGFTFFREKVLTSLGIVDYCKKVSPELFQRCLFIIETALVPLQGNDVSIIANYCQGLPKDLRKQCFVNDSLRLLENDYNNIDKAVDLCKSASSLSNECFKGLVEGSNYVFHKGSAEYLAFCKALPAAWRESCE